MNDRAKRAYIEQVVEAGARSARPLDCPKCGHAVLKGDDHDSCALTATVDAQPIEPIDEMFAVLDGRPTYELRRATGKAAKPGAHELHYREPWQYHSAKPARIHVAHECKPAERMELF